MQLYDGSGQPTAALRQYEEYVRLLEEELGLPPEEETTTLYEAIKAKRILGPHLKGEGPVSQLQPEPSSQSLSPKRDEETQFEKDTGEILASTPRPPPFLKDDSMPRETEAPLFVAREQELAQLNEVLDLALAGQGRVALVIGDAGRGKTVLAQEFTRRAQERDANLVVAAGNCNAYTGVGDPYLPFREILALLTGDVEARWAAGAISREHAQRLWNFTPYSAETLVTTGPDLIDIFIPGKGLIDRAGATAPSDATWFSQLVELAAHNGAGEAPSNVQQSDLFEQYVKVAEALARQQPLLLMLDDLQWADSGSHLSSR
jgi:hypothetical protein